MRMLRLVDELLDITKIELGEVPLEIEPINISQLLERNSSDYSYVAQLVVFKDDPKIWNRLFQAIRTLTDTIKINNIDARLTHKIRAIQMAGLTNTVDQYEMELNLANRD